MEYDLIPFPEDITTLFILESPHSQELEHGYPCSGETGLNMSKKIIPTESIAFGQLLFQKSVAIKEYGVFNTCSFPLGLTNKLTQEQKSIASIKEIKLDTRDRNSCYNSLISFLNTLPELDSKIRYSERLKAILAASSSIENLVVCGFIAQAFFLKIFNLAYPKYNVLTPVNTKSGRSIKILFVNHPSGKNEEWHFNLEKLSGS